MRYCGIIIVSLLIGCKAAPPTSTATYSEDLSVHRPEIETIPADTSQQVYTEAFVPLEGHIKAELDSIVRVSVAQNKEGKRADGFTIQVYAGGSRNEANSVWNRFDELFPELEAKVSYLQPNFRVKAGRFTNRLKAHRIFKEVKAEFPRALLVPERFTMTYE